jgi:hypothetical protein
MSQQLLPPPPTAGQSLSHSALLVQLPHVVPPLLELLVIPELLPLEPPELLPEEPPLLELLPDELPLLELPPLLLPLLELPDEPPLLDALPDELPLLLELTPELLPLELPLELPLPDPDTPLLLPLLPLELPVSGLASSRPASASLSSRASVRAPQPAKTAPRKAKARRWDLMLARRTVRAALPADPSHSGDGGMAPGECAHGMGRCDTPGARAECRELGGVGPEQGLDQGEPNVRCQAVARASVLACVADSLDGRRIA